MYRKEVLAAFKQLHRTRKTVFEGDTYALEVIRGKINEGFTSKKDVNDSNEVKQCIQLAYDVSNELKATVIQAVKKDDGNYRLKIREDYKFQDSSFPFKNMPDEMIGPFSRKGQCTEDKK